MLTYTTYRNETTKQWLTFVHGASADASVWSFQIDFFRKYYNVLVLDFKGFTSEEIEKTTSSNFTFEYVASEVVNVLDMERIDQSHFVGTSLGNIIIRQLLEDIPDRMNGVIMTSAILHFNLMISMLLYLNIFLQRFIPHRILYAVTMVTSTPMPCNKPTREHFFANLHNISKDSYKLWLRLAKENFALMHFFNLIGLRSEVLFISGNQDYIFLPYVKKFVKANKSATLKIIQRSGHGVNIDKKDVYNETVLEYFREIEQRDRYVQSSFYNSVVSR
ncbi:Pimeloyl-ACP methyl ester carboxylesterase [Pustulibacterium marinum]|uniref:Pimeloyl-ACP methyl ester carboxylesterase n=1 Tax=Pustulibacterium marinum TaxID=1224947 RepID=A0A1I7FAX5_9FLAO|nr:alpha/beta hydrolase [Pustulibacterium marinum]SFU33255.1 Pimeloyl-ACP methyl ester carboxylesterase [Pustulibacterium marinum]